MIAASVRRSPRAARRPHAPLRTPIELPTGGWFDRVPPTVIWAALLVLSAGVHLGVVRLRRGTHVVGAEPQARPPIRVVVIDKPHPPPEAVPAPAPPEMAKLVKPRRLLPPPAKVAPVQTVPVTPTPVPETRDEAPPSQQPPLLMPGIALSSTSTAGSFSAPVGNGLAGRPGAISDARAVGEGSDPTGATRVEPGYALSEEPVFLDNVSAAEVRRFYPEEARKAKVEASVATKLVVGSDGRVVRVEIVRDPGNSFGAAAARLARLYRFKPARIGGRAVATEIAFTIHFELD